MQCNSFSFTHMFLIQMAANQISPLRPVVGPKLALVNIGNEHHVVQHTHAHTHALHSRSKPLTFTPLDATLTLFYRMNLLALMTRKRMNDVHK